MADEPLEEKRRDLAEATCKVVIHVRVRVRDITPASATPATPAMSVAIAATSNESRSGAQVMALARGSRPVAGSRSGA